MKTFRLIGMALLAVVMCVNLASCSDDDEEPTKNDDGVITNQKRLVEFTETDEHDTYTWSFSYDSKGRLISIVQKDYDSSSYITNITWGENTIRESEDDESITYSLTDGLARTGSETNGTNYSFAYNSSKQLTAYQRSSSRYDYSDTRTLTWDNGKVTKITDEDGISEITYGNQTCKGYFPFMVTMVEDDFKVMLAHPELVGMRTNQLPEQIFNKYTDKSEYYDEYYKETCKYEYTDEETTKFDYTLNKDGYLESCTVTYTSVETTKRSFTDKNGDGVITDDERNVTETRTRTDIVIYTFKWE